MDCLFCKIVNGDIPATKVYEDDKVLVFFDINPITNGHVLIIPKEHLVTINDITPELATHILEVEKKIYKLFREKLGIPGLTILQNNNLGQEVKHYHVHLIPRYEDDNLKMLSNKDILKDVDELLNKLND